MSGLGRWDMGVMSTAVYGTIRVYAVYVYINDKGGWKIK